MTYDPNQPPYQAPQPMYATPVDYGSLPPAKPTSVMVIGVIGIIFGAMGVICTPFSIVPYVLPKFMPAGAQQANPMVELVTSSTPLMIWTIFSTSLSMVLAIVLLTGSIGSVRLSRWARKLMIGYSIVALIAMVLGLVVMLAVMLPMMMSRMNGGSAEQTGAFVGGIFGGIFGILFGSALPIAILICYRRPNVVAAFEHRPYGT